MKQNINNLESWVFTFNTYERLWCATKRENYIDLFNDYKSKNVIRNSNINTLIEVISKGVKPIDLEL